MTPPNAVPVLRLAGAALYIAALPALMLLLAGDARWIEGWLFAAWFVGLCAIVMTWLYLKDPALLSERFRQPGSGGQGRSDRMWVYVIQVSFIAWIVIMPLDARRFGWTPPFALWVRAVGGALLLASSFLFFRAFHDNTFLSPLVRVQEERKQHVVSTGVYGFVRHPMYLGAVLLLTGTPLLLGSTVGLAIGGLMTLLLALRILQEERLLTNELDGYAQYRRKVRYRLLPFLW
jgi:protein-S-isoprenylcysteine O-methyltransferase Ste14